jgi:hypothetical protein
MSGSFKMSRFAVKHFFPTHYYKRKRATQTRTAETQTLYQGDVSVTAQNKGIEAGQASSKEPYKKRRNINARQKVNFRHQWATQQGAEATVMARAATPQTGNG